MCRPGRTVQNPQPPLHSPKPSLPLLRKARINPYTPLEFFGGDGGPFSDLPFAARDRKREPHLFLRMALRPTLEGIPDLLSSPPTDQENP